MWVCDYHNEVNDELDKELEDCMNVGVLWGKEACDCDVVEDDDDDFYDDESKFLNEK